MFHLAAFFSTISSNDNALHQITSVPDPIARQSNNGLIVPPQMRNIAYILGGGLNCTRIQLQSPSLRVQPFPTILPVSVTAAMESPARDADYWDNPLQVDPYEEIDAYSAQNGGTAGNHTILVAFADAPASPVRGNFIRARWTATTTLVAGAWTACNITFDQSLQVGNYAVVGGWATSSATGLAWRVVPPSGNVNRPGGPILGTAYDALINRIFRNGRLGQWTTFNSLTPPQIEVLASAADTSQAGVLDLLAL